jgi:diaminohydroxyphosphoribosylaminopyrimidine deaminase/5-amino-6-(5-phosphoribosylamino)uracil reductase
MRRALALAERGRGSTRPNPVVGAVLVRDGRVVGEGYHVRPGEPHAEVHALAAAGAAARGATLYVSLEPCCHTGRTGPCTEAILAAGPTRVVVGYRDPNPRVDGRGTARLRRAGIRVDVGCLEAECRAANRAFAVWIREGRPLVTLKAAVTLDGFLADRFRRARRAPVWITGEAARREAHVLRAAHDAVLVGAGTVRADDPRLTVRLPGLRGAPGPLRVVLDGRLRTPATAHLLDGGPPTLIVTAADGPGRGRARALEARGAEVLALPGRDGRVALRRVLGALAEREVQSLLVEGGAEVLGAFVDARLVDRVALFVAPRLLGAGVPMAAGRGVPVAQALRLGPIAARPIDGDLLLTADVEPIGANP